MQDFDTLRNRVEETAERLSLAQSERQQETQSLIGILQDLEEKYSAQEKQFAYYRDRLEPLERSNAQLTTLIENLLELIDRGFGEERLDPLRKASDMASAMLRNDFWAADDATQEHDGNFNSKFTTDAISDAVTDAASETASGADADAAAETDSEFGAETMHDAEPEMATLDDIEDDFEEGGEHDAVQTSGEEQAVQVIQDLVDLIDEGPETAHVDPVAAYVDETSAAGEGAFDDDHDEANVDGVTDLELEEVALSNLEEDIEAASDYIGTDLDAVAAMDLAYANAADEPDPAAAVSEDAAWSPVDGVSADDVAAGGETPWADEPDMTVRFEDVSDAVLESELEEDASAGTDDLPDVVKSAAAAFASGDTTSEAETIEALARAMEEETRSNDTPPPAQSDIRSLMLRVEALAKKAEAMRLAQVEETGTDESAEDAGDRQEATTNGGAASDTDKKNSGVAA